MDFEEAIGMWIPLQLSLKKQVLLFLGTGFLFLSSLARAEHPKDLNLDGLKSYFISVNCSKNARQFLACTLAIDGLLQSSLQEFQLVLVDGVTEFRPGTNAFLRSPQEKSSRKQFLEDIKKNNAGLIKYYQNEFESLKKFDLEQIFKNLHKIIVKEPTAEQILQTINHYRRHAEGIHNRYTFTNQISLIAKEKQFSPQKKILKMFEQKIGVIQIETFFQKNLCELIKDELKYFTLEKASSIILDLRDNDGGYRDQSRCLVGLFLGPGQDFIKEYSIEEPYTEMVADKTVDLKIWDLPIVVIVNEKSASASEIVASALQDSNRALVVGNRTSGKGVSQRFFQVSDRLFDWQTTTFLVRKNGDTFHAKGIKPDIVIGKMGALSALEIDPITETTFDIFPLPTQYFLEAKEKNVSNLEAKICVENKLQKISESFLKTDLIDHQILTSSAYLSCL